MGFTPSWVPSPIVPWDVFLASTSITVIVNNRCSRIYSSCNLLDVSLNFNFKLVMLNITHAFFSLYIYTVQFFLYWEIYLCLCYVHVYVKSMLAIKKMCSQLTIIYNKHAKECIFSFHYDILKGNSHHMEAHVPT